MSIDWVAPAIGFVVLEGILGITIKLAFREIRWPELLLWTAMAYGVLALAMVVLGGESLSFGSEFGWGIVSGVFAALSLLVFFVALEHGEASRVVPISAAYPMVTAIVAAIVLSEQLTVLRVLGTSLVVAGVVSLSRE